MNGSQSIIVLKKTNRVKVKYGYMRRIFVAFKNIVAKNWFAIVTIGAASILRLYRLPEFARFLGDEGRDAIVVKRILTLEHFPAVGAPTSVGQVYLGPFYYYFVSPWLALFKFDPVGLAYGVAIFSIVFLVVIYLILRHFFNKKVAAVATFLASFSYVLIELSRFSWNPNLLPLFSLLTAFFFLKGLKTKSKVLFFLFGAFFSFSVQLHYLALSLGLPVLIIGLEDFLDNVKTRKEKIVNYLVSFASFVIFFTPLLIFDLRHNFLNLGNFIRLLQSGSAVGGGKLFSLVSTIADLNRYLFNISFNNILALILFVIILVLFFLNLKKEEYYFRAFIIFFIGALVVISLYPGVKHPHYLGMLYGFYIIVIARILSDFVKRGVFDKALVLLFLIAFLYLNSKNYDVLKRQSNNQIGLAKNIAQKIYENAGVNNFQVTSLPEKYSDSTYRYFLEIWGKRPNATDSMEKADELFVVCENKCEPIIGNPLWDIAYFAPREIVGEWTVRGVKIYKLIR